MLLPEHEVIRLLGMTKQAFTNLRSAGAFKAKTFDKREGRFYEEEDVVEFVANRKRPSPLARQIDQLLEKEMK
jgi:hypothetical protein